MGTPWTPLRRLAIGGTAELWLAAGPGGQTWVIKQLFPDHGPEALEALRRERALLERLDSPHVVRCLGGADDWLALEWIDGVDVATLAAHARRRGAALPAEAAVEVLLGACRGLAALHAAGYVHGDVSPGNVLLGRDGRVVLADLGQATPRGAGAPSGPEGTLLYQPPEQLRGASRAPAMDLYALALGVYELVTGTLARPAGMLGLAELMAARASAPLPAASVRPGVPAALDRLLLPALDPDPARRPPSAEAWLAAARGSGLAPSRERLVSAVEAAAKRAIPATATAHEARAAPVPDTTRAAPVVAAPAPVAAGARGEPLTDAATTLRADPPAPTTRATAENLAREPSTRTTEGRLARDAHDTTHDVSEPATVATPRRPSLARALGGPSGPRPAAPSDTVARALASPSGAADTLPEPHGHALRTEVTASRTPEALPTLPTWSLPAQTGLAVELAEPPTLGTVPDTWVTPSALTPLPDLTGPGRLRAASAAPTVPPAAAPRGGGAPRAHARWMLPAVIAAVAVAGVAIGLWLSRAHPAPAPLPAAEGAPPTPSAPIAAVSAAPSTRPAPLAERPTTGAADVANAANAASTAGVAGTADRAVDTTARPSPRAPVRAPASAPGRTSAAPRPSAPAPAAPDASPAVVVAPAVPARRVVVAAPSCAVRVTGPGVATTAPTRTEPRNEDTVLELAGEAPAWRLIVRVDLARGQATLGAPRGRFAQVACGQDPPRPTPLHALSLARPLRCEVLVSASERCAFTLLLQDAGP